MLDDIHTGGRSKYEENTIKIFTTSPKDIPYNTDHNTYIIDNNQNIPLILHFLLKGHNVMYVPPKLPYALTMLTNVSNPQLINMDLVYYPILHINDNHNTFYRSAIDLTKPVLFRYKNPILINFLSMYVSIDDFSETLQNGTYELISRIRLGYCFQTKNTKFDELNEFKWYNKNTKTTNTKTINNSTQRALPTPTLTGWTLVSKTTNTRRNYKSNTSGIKFNTKNQKPNNDALVQKMKNQYMAWLSLLYN